MPWLSARRCLRFLPVLAWMGIIFFGSSRQNINIPPAPNGWSVERPIKKVAHICEYATLAFLVGWAIGGATGRTLAICAAVAAVYGASDEIHQAFVPTRHARLFDVGVDTVGGCLGAWAWRQVWRRKDGKAPGD
jgi:VanZ family protein